MAKKGLFALLRKIRKQPKVKIKPVSLKKIKKTIESPAIMAMSAGQKIGFSLKKRKIYGGKSIYK